MSHAPTSLKLKRLMGKFYRLTSPPRDRRVILIYHSVGGGEMSTPVEVFARQMQWLRDNARVEPLDELISSRDGSGLRVAITFDDGYGSLYDNVAAILKDADFSATTFVNTGKIAEAVRSPSDDAEGHYPGETFLLWKELEDLSRLGWTIGSHGVDHLDLTRLSASEAQYQLTQSRKTIDDRMGGKTPGFCYTWGIHSSSVERMAAEAGYRYAVAALHGPVAESSKPYALPRIDIRQEYTLNDFICAVTGEWDFLATLQMLRKRVN